ncbi:hypothetical protein ACSBR2_037795 [Camellia fascicularis]
MAGFFWLMWRCAMVIGVFVDRRMDAHVMLVCCYHDTNAAIKLQFPFRFEDLVTCVRQNFDGLIHVDVCFFFKIPGYNSFKLQNDINVENMVSLARSFRLGHIDVVIQTQFAWGRRRVKNDDEQDDVLPKFYPHVNKVFMSAPWANGITHVGQSFEGGAAEFRNVLHKYVVEYGFRFKYLKNDSVRITAVCTIRESKGCMWSIHAQVLCADEFFYIHKWNTEHSCGVPFRHQKT